MPKVYLRTFGCQMNERDSEQVAQMFVERGFTVTSQPDEADVVLLNSCSVRDQAEQKALGNMRQLGKHRKTKPNLVFGMMGCMAQSRGEQLLKEVPHLDLVVGTQKYHRVVDHCVELMRAKEEAQMDDLRGLSRPGCLGYSLYTWRVGDLEAMRARLATTPGVTALGELRADEFGRTSLGFTAPDGCAWVLQQASATESVSLRE